MARAWSAVLDTLILLNPHLILLNPHLVVD